MSLSPLRYPGGKSRAIKILEKLIPDCNELVSPFFGGGSFELHCANEGFKVKGYDIFEPLVDFWQCLKENPQRLAQIIQKYHPLSKERFYELQKNQEKINDSFERAAIFFVLNRASFSGSTLSGGMSLGHPRFNQACIDKIKDFNCPNFDVSLKSFEHSIKENTGKFFYCDPPYLIKYGLYGKSGDTHKGFNHQLLLECLQNEPLWLLSYNNCDEIMNMYKGFDFIFPDWKYGMSKDKSAKEVLFFSEKLFHIVKNNL